VAFVKVGHGSQLNASFPSWRRTDFLATIIVRRV
jgi:hypothetical protein